MSAPTHSGGQHEFTDADNQTIGALGKNMGIVGFYLMLVGIIYVVATAAHVVNGIARKDVGHAVAGGLASGIGALLYLVMGSWTRGSADSFKQVVKTQGSDVTHLMNALGQLNKLYALLATLIIIALIILVLVVVVALILAITAGMRTG